MEFFQSLSWPGAIAFAAVCLFGSLILIAAFAALVFSNLEITWSRQSKEPVETGETNTQQHATGLEDSAQTEDGFR